MDTLFFFSQPLHLPAFRILPLFPPSLRYTTLCTFLDPSGQANLQPSLCNLPVEVQSRGRIKGAVYMRDFITG